MGTAQGQARDAARTRLVPNSHPGIAAPASAEDADENPFLTADPPCCPRCRQRPRPSHGTRRPATALLSPEHATVENRDNPSAGTFYLAFSAGL